MAYLLWYTSNRLLQEADSSYTFWCWFAEVRLEEILQNSVFKGLQQPPKILVSKRIKYSSLYESSETRSLRFILYSEGNARNTGILSAIVYTRIMNRAIRVVLKAKIWTFLKFVLSKEVKIANKTLVEIYYTILILTHVLSKGRKTYKHKIWNIFLYIMKTVKRSLTLCILEEVQLNTRFDF